jgi:hypothetical protein
MSTEQVGSFRTRTTGDGSLEVWARGWRLESPLYALIPAGLALMFVLTGMPVAMRVGGAVVMLAAGLLVFRLQKPGLLFAQDAVTVVGVVRTRRFSWDGVSGFMGERRHDEGRVLLVLEGDERVPLPGTLDPSELDPYGEEGEMLSAVDQLNRLGERARAGQLPKPTAPVAAAPAPKKRRAPTVPRVKLPTRKAVDEGGSKDAEPRSTAPAPAAAAPVASTAPALDLMQPPTPAPADRGRHVVKAPPPIEHDGPLTRKQRRSDRKELKRALKAVKLTKDGRAIAPVASSRSDDATTTEEPRRRLRRRRDPSEPLSSVPIAEPPARTAPPRRAAEQPAAGHPSYFPQPTYIPQEEYARMLREQRAAEKAAAAAAAELSELADLDHAETVDEPSLDRGWSG